jgi:serine/threonine protein kinase
LQLLLLTHLLDIAKGMAYLHEQQVLHADLKPANVLLCSPGGTAQALLEEGSAAAEVEEDCCSSPRSKAVQFRDMQAKISDFGLSHGMALGQSHHQTATVSAQLALGWVLGWLRAAFACWCAVQAAAGQRMATETLTCAYTCMLVRRLWFAQCAVFTSLFRCLCSDAFEQAGWRTAV